MESHALVDCERGEKGKKSNTMKKEKDANKGLEIGFITSGFKKGKG